MLRDIVLTRMGRYGDKATVAEAEKRFLAHASGEQVLPADLRGPVCIAISFEFCIYSVTVLLF